MKIMERLAIVAHRSAKKTTPERAPILAARPQAVMVPIGELPELMQAQLGHDRGDVSGHADQQGAKANVLARRVPGDGQYVACHLHVNDPRKYATAEFRVIRSRPALRLLPPLTVSELKIGQGEWASTCSVARLVIQGHPKTSMNAQNVRQSRCVSPLRRAREAFQVPTIECLDQIEARATDPTGHRHSGGCLWLLPFPGSTGHLRSPQSGVDNVLLKHLGRTSNRLRVVADMHC